MVTHTTIESVEMAGMISSWLKLEMLEMQVVPDLQLLEVLELLEKQLAKPERELLQAKS